MLIFAGGLMMKSGVVLAVLFTVCIGSIQARSTAAMLRSLISELSKKSDTCTCPNPPPEGGPPGGGPPARSEAMEEEFECGDGSFIPAMWVNDLEDDCGDCSDESACSDACAAWGDDGYDATCWGPIYEEEKRKALAKKDATCACPDWDADTFNSADYDDEWNYIGAEFTCANGKKIQANFENDAWDDCGDCSDEPACSGCVSSGDEMEPWMDDCWTAGMSYFYDEEDLIAEHNDEHDEAEHGAPPEAAAAPPLTGTAKRQGEPPKGMKRQQGPPQGMKRQQGPPQGMKRQQGPPQGMKRQQGPPQGMKRQQGPPQGMKRQEEGQGPHTRHVLRNIAKIMKKGMNHQ